MAEIRLVPDSLAFSSRDSQYKSPRFVNHRTFGASSNDSCQHRRNHVLTARNSATAIMITGGDATRARAEFWVRTVTMHVVALTCYGHLGSILHRPTARRQEFWRLCAFALAPALPLVEVVIRFENCIKKAMAEGIVNILIFFSSFVGMRAKLNSNTSTATYAPLHEIHDVYLFRTTNPLTWEWFGRVIVQVFALLQAIGTAALYFRRLRHGEEGEQTKFASLLDHRAGLMAISASVICLNTVVALVLHCDWGVIPTYPGGTVRDSNLAVEAAIAIAIHAICRNEKSPLTPIASLLEHDEIDWHPVTLLILILFGLYMRRRDTLARLGIIAKIVGSLLLLLFSYEAVGALCVDIYLAIVESSLWEEYWHWKDPISEMLFVI